MCFTQILPVLHVAYDVCNEDFVFRFFLPFPFCTVTTFNIILLFFLRSTFTLSLVDCSVLHNFYNPYLFCMVLDIKNTQ